MVILDKKEKSLELNDLKRTLIDFKSLIDSDTFIIYKLNNLIYYIFDNNGFSRVIKTSEFLKLEDFLDNDEYINVSYSELREVTELKKAEITDIRYDTNGYVIDITKDEGNSCVTIKKQKDVNNILKSIIAMTSNEKLSSDFLEVTYDVKKQMLKSENEGKIYPYKITFSDDINFKLKIEKPESKYHMKTLNDGAFLQVVTTSKYKDIYYAQTILFVFNYLNNREI